MNGCSWNAFFIGTAMCYCSSSLILYPILASREGASPRGPSGFSCRGSAGLGSSPIMLIVREYLCQVFKLFFGRVEKVVHLFPAELCFIEGAHHWLFGSCSGNLIQKIFFLFLR